MNWLAAPTAKVVDFHAVLDEKLQILQGQSLGASTLPLGQAYPIVSGENANAANQPASNS